MGTLSTLAGLLGLSVVSGVNLYLAVLAVGLAQRFHWITGLPSELSLLSHPAVLIAAGLLFLLEFFADKIPFVTVVWDAVHTFIRPVGGALLAVGAVGHAHPAFQTVAALAGGSIALGTHGTKMGLRMLAHSAPEPTTHSLISVGEDLTVVGLLALAYAHPAIAIPILVAVILLVAILLPFALRGLNMLLMGVSGRLMASVSKPGRAQLPAWADMALLERHPTGNPRVARAFARKLRGVPWLKEGVLVESPEGWGFLYRRFFRTRFVNLETSPVRKDQGFLWDALRFLRKEKLQTCLVPKDWSANFEEAMPPAR